MSDRAWASGGATSAPVVAIGYRFRAIVRRGVVEVWRSYTYNRGMKCGSKRTLRWSPRPLAN